MTRIARHWEILAAFMFAVALAGPFFIAGGPVYPELVNDQNYYLARIQEVREGNLSSGNPYLAELKGVPPVSISLGEYAYVFLPAFIFPPLIFLLMYVLARSVGAPRFWALMATIFLLCGTYFFTFARPISPQFNLIFWLAAVIGLFSGRAVFTAFVVGALFYMYPYYWTHLLAVCGLLFLWYRSPKFIGIILGAAVVGSYALWLSYAARALPYFDESLMRLGFVETHTPSGVTLAAVSCALLATTFWWAWRKKTFPQSLIVAGSLVLGGVIAMNQHLVTGINMEFSSHYGPLIVFADALLVIAAISAFNWWKFCSKLWVKIPAFLLILVWCAPFVLSPYIYAEKQKGSTDAYTPIIEWLNENAEPEEVVYAPEELASFIPAYTAQNVFYARAANFGFMPNQEVIDRFIIQNYRAGFTEAFIIENERLLFGQQYVNAYNHALQKQKFLKLFGISVDLPERIPAEAIARVQSRAAELQSQPLSSLLAPYRTDYLILPMGQNPLSGVPVFSTDRFNIFTN